MGPKFEGVPQVRASDAASFSLHWSDDARLRWVLGPELMTFTVGDEKPPKKGRAIGFDANTDTHDGIVAVVGAKIVTMKGDEVIDGGTLVAKGDRIVAVGADVRVPAGAHVIDGKGKTVVPGLIDVHWHGAQAANGMTPQAAWSNLAALAFGVTTVHDPSHDSESIFSAAELQRAGRIPAPRIFSTGTILYGADAPSKAEVESLDDARAHLRRMKAIGARSVKSYNQPRRDQRKWVLEAAREAKMMVVPEGGALFHHNLTQVVDGHTGIEHALPLAKTYADVSALWSRTDVGYTPTLTVAYGGLMGEHFWYQMTDVFEHPRLIRFVPAYALDPKSRRRIHVEEDDFNHVAAARDAKRLLDAGVRVQIGGHGQREGLGVHWEMWSLAQGGATPLEVLRAATLHGAFYLGMDRDLGSLEPGKLADFLVLDGDVLTNIRDSEKILRVVQGGRVYDPDTMNELSPRRRARPKLHFQR